VPARPAPGISCPADFENSDSWLGGLEESATYNGKPRAR
jgi:hypothetical protein